MNLLVPAAGAGRRFAEAGYKEPKPFIKIGKRTMIDTVLRNLSYEDFETRVIIQREHEDYWDKTDSWPAEKIVIDGITEGAACTVLLAKNFINNEQPLVLANSDQIIGGGYWIRSALNYFFAKNADCGVVCFLNDNPKWSYARVEGERITKIAEKNPISQIATCGIYYFKRGKDFVWAAEDMIAKNIRTNNEFYVAPAINQLIERGGKVVPFMINEMYGTGTPEDLKEYMECCL